MTKFLATLCICIASFAAVADDIKLPAKLDADGFQGVLADAGKVFISGQPTPEGLKRLKAEGVTTVISFRTPHEMDDREIVPFDEAALVTEMGMTYINIPLGGDAHPYTPEALEKFASAMKALDGKALIHCTVAWRASHVWSAYLAKYEGVDINTAVAHGRAANMGVQPVEALLGGVTYSVGEPEKH